MDDAIETAPGEKRFLHSKDILRNLSVFSGRCWFCGETAHESITREIKEGWIECICGNILHAKNSITWS